ncbi:zinc ABC transporter substrate-binding protein [Schaalia sp. 19OD2882]|uniref:metal ABC transporter substrate-binding protein n=1 Tax=Schaalia sp. 19OD2882 TaxID=2794089 RepID=UPI001C1F1C3C|nr:metal ABC transporter substrate-binding protein [Schaalia sp. 19OD2882]QWW19017.1 zinc ABC transporter substrate-binding protein [Schaalia sp. 19OD2882]
MSMTIRPVLASTAALGTLALVLTGCGNTAPQSDAAASGSTLHVMSAFYPLQYLTEQVGGDLVTVESLTPAGGEPHDLELSLAQVGALGQADAVVYLKGFQAVVDEAVEQNGPKTVIDVSTSVQLLEGNGDHDHDHHAMSGNHEDGAASGHDHDAMSGDHDHDHTMNQDPHFWLDPTRMGQAAMAIGQALADADPAHAQTYSANAAATKKKMDQLATDLVNGTKSCEHTTFVTAHEAFGYLADRTKLTQVGISGLDPEASPSHQRLEEIAGIAKAEGVTTIFTEALIDPKAAKTIADDLGITTAVLDPIESQVDPAKDYEAAMRANIDALRSALSCK